MNSILRWILLPLAGIVLLAGSATAALGYSTVGASELEHPEGLSLRQESTRPGGSFFVWYGSSRSHLGGGLRGGK